MSFSSTGTSSSHNNGMEDNNGMEGEDVSLPTKKKNCRGGSGHLLQNMATLYQKMTCICTF